jgi:hypothetical protein
MTLEGINTFVDRLINHGAPVVKKKKTYRDRRRAVLDEILRQGKWTVKTTPSS